jgi:ferredoxin-NADP reductase
MSEAIKAEMLNLVVTNIRTETSYVRSLTLATIDGARLPEWTAGAHIDIELPSGARRSYSLIDTSIDGGQVSNPEFYRIGVRREEPSTGGSEFIHDLEIGDHLVATRPKNNFELAAPQAGEIVLLAGGIGITPLISMAAELARSGRLFRLIYAGRTRADLAFIGELQTLIGERLEIHEDDRSGTFALAAFMRSLPESTSLYVCGPTSMIDASIEMARSLKWAEGRLHFEIFARPHAVEGGAGFEVVLARTGKRFWVAPDKSILDTLVAFGEEPPHDCKRGDCGICQVGVLEGTPDHRDYYLSDKERASNKLMQICVSRSKTPVLVLDM